MCIYLIILVIWIENILKFFFDQVVQHVTKNINKMPPSYIKLPKNSLDGAIVDQIANILFR